MEQSVYQEHIEQEETHWWFVARRAICSSLLARVRLPQNPVVLEAGCGSGGNLPTLAKIGKVFAFELSDIMLTQAKARNIGVIEHGKLPDEIPFSEQKFDLITMFDVLEHIEDDASALSALVTRLNADGALFITVPAFGWLFSQHDRLHHHFRRYSKKELIAKIQAAGLAVEYTTYWNIFLFPVVAAIRIISSKTTSKTSIGTKTPASWLNNLMIKLVSSEKFIIPKINVPFGLSIILIARKK